MHACVRVIIAVALLGGCSDPEPTHFIPSGHGDNTTPDVFPHLEVAEGLVPGETATITMSDAPEGASVVLYGGLPTEEACGTTISFLGEACLSPSHARLLAPMGLTDGYGEVDFTLPIPPHFPLGQEIELQGVILGPPHTLTSTLTTMMHEGVRCEAASPTVELGVSPGDTNVRIGTWHCQALAGAIAIHDLTFATPAGVYTSYTLTVGETKLEIPASVGPNGLTSVLYVPEEVEAGGVINITLTGNVDPAARCGADATPTLTDLEAIGLQTEEWPHWDESLPGTTTTVACP